MASQCPFQGVTYGYMPCRYVSRTKYQPEGARIDFVQMVREFPALMDALI